MSDVSNTANAINVAFPNPGANNSTEGFRANWRGIKSTFDVVNGELDFISATGFRFGGDATGTSTTIGQAVQIGGGARVLDVAFTLANTLSGPQTVNTNTGDFSLTFDAKGRLTSYVPVQHQITWAGTNAANAVVDFTGASMGIGTGQIDFPTFTFDASGRLTATSVHTVYYGIQNQTLTRGALLVGGVTNKSVELTAPTDDATYALVAVGKNLSWQPVGAGTVSGVVGGAGIKSNGDAASPTISLDLTKLDSNVNIADADELIYQSASDNTAKRLTLAQFRNKVSRVAADSSPALGGTLDVGGFHVVSTNSNGVVLDSALVDPKTSLAITQTGASLVGGAGTKITIQSPTVQINAPALNVATSLLTLGGPVNMTGALTLVGNTTQTGSMSLSGAFSTLSTLNVGGAATFGAGATFAGDVSVTGLSTFGGSVDIRAGLKLAGDSFTATTTTLALSGTTLTLQSPSLKLNGLQWPNAAGTAGQFLTQGANNTLVWAAPQAFFQTIPNTLFVGAAGSDTQGNGALNAPYQTIAKAISMVPNNDATRTYTIMLLGGTYTENVDILNKTNIALEGFFGSTNSVIKGNVQVLFNVDSFLMSKITIDTSGQDASNTQATFSILGGLNNGVFKDCQFLRGDASKSDLTAVSVNGQLGGDIAFTNCTIQGKIENSAIADGNRVVFQNCGLPENGWTGLKVKPATSTLISGAPLMKGIEHNGGILVMENIGSIMPENYTVSVTNPDLPKWESGKPKFVTTTGTDAFEDDTSVTLIRTQDDDGNLVEVLLLDPQGNPIDDPNNAGESLKTQYAQFKVAQPDTVKNYTVGLYSVANSDTGDAGNGLELTNVNFYYQGAFSKLYKAGNCQWSFTRVKRRSDQDYITGPRLAYDVQPDEGNFMAHYVASGNNLRYEDDNSVVPDGVVDPKSGNTFMVTLTNNATLTMKTPEATAYAPGPLVTSGELYSEVLVAVKQDALGGRQVSFTATGGQAITWISNTAPNIVPGGLTFYLFRYFSRTRTWVGQKQVDASGMKVSPVTTAVYTLQATDAGSYIRRSNASGNQVIVPNNTSVQFNIGVQIQITQIGVGRTEIVPGNGVVINTPDGRILRKRFSQVTLTKVASNIWDLTGDLDATQTTINAVTADDQSYTADNATLKASNG